MPTTFFDSTSFNVFNAFTIPDLCSGASGGVVKGAGSSFTVSLTSAQAKISSVKIGVSTSATPGTTWTYNVEIYAVGAGNTVGTLVGTLVSGQTFTTLAGQTNQAQIIDLTSVLTPVIVNGNTRYWLIVRDPTSSGFQFNTVQVDGTNHFPGEYTADCSPLINGTSNTPFIMFVAGDPVGIANNRYGVKTFLQPSPANQIPYRLCVNNNRLHCLLPDNTGIFSDFVYYLGRENNQGGYWYRYVIDPAALFSEEDGNLFGGFGDAGVGNLFNLDVANISQFAGTNIQIDVIFPMSKEEINQRKDVYHLTLHLDTGNLPLNLTGYTDFGAATAFSLGTVTTNGVKEFNILIQNTNFNLAKRMAIELCGATSYFKLVDWSIDYNARPEPLSFLRIATNYGLAAKKRLRTIPIVIDTRGSSVGIQVIADGVSLGTQNFTTNERVTVFYYMNTDVFATDLIINITAASGKVFEYYEAPAPVNVETLPVGKLFDQIGPVELERIGALLEFRVRMLATTNTITYNVFMDDVSVVSAGVLTVTPNVDKTYGPIKMPKGIQGSVCRIEFLSSNGVFYRWNCKLKFTTGGTKSDTKQITIQDASMGLQR